MRTNSNDPRYLELAEAVQDGLPGAELSALGARLFPEDPGMAQVVREEKITIE